MHLATRCTICIHILYRCRIIIQLEPRLGHDAAYLQSLLLGGALHQGIALRHYGTVVTLLEIDLHQVEGHQITVYGALCKRLESLT